jgi:hypothetical protein
MFELFPPNGIDQTIHVAIWLGLLLSLFLTETFGWTFSGLVVPGYLASLFVLEPASAIAVVFEAVLTFAVARAISEVASRSGAWSKFFGRERFLLVIFVSIAVRQISELWLLPEIARVIDARFETTLRLSHTLSSIGLVLVPLTANAFWKVGLRRGMFQVAVPTAITYAVIAYVLLPYTNLSFSRLELTYENVALDFLSSPKAYILLIAGAFLGSRYNLRYGWDYAGILIPALLGLAWLSPLRILTTLIESLLLVLVVRILVRLPWFRTLNLEGPRKVALVFTVSFAAKWTLGWFVGPTFHGLKVVELFGFGYLLSSLIAVKILQKDAISRIAVPSIAVGVAGWVAGSFIGFGLDKIAPAPPPLTASPTVLVAAAPQPATTTLLRSTMGVLALGHARSRLPDAEIVVTPAQRDQYTAMWHAIAQWLARPSEAAQHDVLARATGLGMVLLPVDGGFALYRRDERLDAPLAWDTAMLMPGAQGPVIVVPRPASEAPSAEVAAVLCARVHCRAAIVAGREVDPDAIARRAFAGVPTFEVRTDDTIKAAMFHVAEQAPDIDVAALWPPRAGVGLELSWARPPAGTGGVLRANPDAYWGVLAERAQPIAPVAQTIDAWFAEWAGSTPVQPAKDTSAPSQTELRFLEVALGAPAIAGRSLRGVRTLAALVGYEVVQLVDGTWLIAETAWPRSRGWGVLAGRTKGAPVTIEIPRPRREAGTLRLGVEAFRRTNASVLVVADPDVVADRLDADPVAPWNLATPLHAFHAAAFHARRETPGAAILQIRGYGATQPIQDPVVVTAWRSILGKDQVPPQLGALVENLSFLGAARYHDGSRELLDLAGTGNPQLEYCERYEAMQCALVWVSETVRTEFREADRDRELATLKSAGVEIVGTSPVEALAGGSLEPSPLPPAASARFDEIAKILEGYAADGNVQRLRLLDGKVHLRGGYSEEVGRAYLQFDLVDGPHVARGLVLVPAGKLRADIAPGEGLARRLDAALAHRPLSIRISGVIR